MDRVGDKPASDRQRSRLPGSSFRIVELGCTDGVLGLALVGELDIAVTEVLVSRLAALREAQVPARLAMPLMAGGDGDVALTGPADALQPAADLIGRPLVLHDHERFLRVQRTLGRDESIGPGVRSTQAKRP